MVTTTGRAGKNHLHHRIENPNWIYILYFSYNIITRFHFHLFLDHLVCVVSCLLSLPVQFAAKLEYLRTYYVGLLRATILYYLIYDHSYVVETHSGIDAKSLSDASHPS